MAVRAGRLLVGLVVKRPLGEPPRRNEGRLHFGRRTVFPSLHRVALGALRQKLGPARAHQALAAQILRVALQKHALFQIVNRGQPPALQSLPLLLDPEGNRHRLSHPRSANTGFDGGVQSGEEQLHRSGVSVGNMQVGKRLLDLERVALLAVFFKTHRLIKHAVGLRLVTGSAIQFRVVELGNVRAEMAGMIELKIGGIPSLGVLIAKTRVPMGEAFKGSHSLGSMRRGQKKTQSLPKVNGLSTRRDGGRLGGLGAGIVELGEGTVAVGAGLAGGKRHPVRAGVFSVATRAGDGVDQPALGGGVEPDVPRLGSV